MTTTTRNGRAHLRAVPPPMPSPQAPAPAPEAEVLPAGRYGGSLPAGVREQFFRRRSDRSIYSLREDLAFTDVLIQRQVARLAPYLAQPEGAEQSREEAGLQRGLQKLVRQRMDLIGQEVKTLGTLARVRNDEAMQELAQGLSVVLKEVLGDSPEARAQYARIADGLDRQIQQMQQAWEEGRR